MNFKKKKVIKNKNDIYENTKELILYDQQDNFQAVISFRNISCIIYKDNKENIILNSISGLF